MLRRNRDAFNAFVAKRHDLDCMPAEHGITAFPRWTGGDTERLDNCLHEQFDAGIVPGRWFETREHFRIGFGYPVDHFDEGLKRLGAALDSLR
jgi:hypothetical protein